MVISVDLSKMRGYNSQFGLANYGYMCEECNKVYADQFVAQMCESNHKDAEDKENVQ